jgi:hypothetical protein
MIAAHDHASDAAAAMPSAPRGMQHPLAAGEGRPSQAAAILQLQRTAGNRAVRLLLRRVTADVLTGPIGDVVAEQLTPDELREQAGRVVGALASSKLSADDRRNLEDNLRILEDWAAGHGIEVPAATAHRLREVIDTLAVDLRVMGATAKELAATKYANDITNIHESPTDRGAPFGGALAWAVDQLDWATDTLTDAARTTAAAESGGAESARQFRIAGTLLTAAIAVSKAAAAYLAYLKVAVKVEAEHPRFQTAQMQTNLRMVHHAFNPLLRVIRRFDSSGFDKAVDGLLKEIPTWRFPFSQWIDDLEEALHKRERFLQWVNIAMLAWLAFDIAMLPVAGKGGGPSSPGGPRIWGPPGGGAAVAGGGVLITVESLAALRRLIRLGILSNPGLVKVVGGGPQPAPKPIQASTKSGPKGGAPSPTKPAPKATPTPKPDPTARPMPGLPTAKEDAILHEYTRGLARLRERRQILHDAEKAQPRVQKQVDRARASLAGTQRELEAIETRAANEEGELFDHLTPLRKDREILTNIPLNDLPRFPTGKRVPCEAVRRAPKNIRGRDYVEIEHELGRPPDHIDAADQPAGAGTPSAHQRLRWTFEDGSALIVDLPRKLETARAHPSADLPHVELHGPRGERLDPQGIAVPAESTSAHLTITDHTRALEHHFAPARAKGKK